MTDQFFAGNRRTLAQSMQVPIILTGYTALQKKGDAAHAFKQEANFWYLTGIEEPDWSLVLLPDGDTTLVAPTRSDVHMVFDGGLSAEQAARRSGADAVITQEALIGVLESLATKYDSVGTLGKDRRASHYDFIENPSIAQLRRRLQKQFKTIVDVRLPLAKQRAIKQPEELRAIREAIRITSDAFEDVKALLPTLTYEYEVEAEFTYRFRKFGAIGHAYDPIVAARLNACTLHYGANTDTLGKGLLLLDIGAEVDGYAADITRTYAVGEPTEREKTVHAAVEQAHHAIIDLLKPGYSVMAYHDAVDEIMNRALESLGLIKEADDYRRYFPHAVSHGLGVDVHDSLGAPEYFAEGMVLTVEPGIYIPEEAIGVRIEDDILITNDGHENLSGNLSTRL